MVVMPRSEKKLNDAIDLIDDLWVMAKETLEGDGYHAPMVFVMQKRAMQIIDVTKLIAENMKDELADLVKQIASAPETEAIALVTEAWRYTASDMDLAEVWCRAAESGLESIPGRVEALQIQAELRNGSKAMRWAEIRRGDDGKLSGLSDVEDMNGVEQSGRLCNFFE